MKDTKYVIKANKGVGSICEFIGYVTDLNDEIAKLTEEEAMELLENLTTAKYLPYVMLRNASGRKELHSYTEHQKRDIYFVGVKQ